MSYFSCFSQTHLKELFFIPPAKDLNSLTREHLSYALGALLYMPASSWKMLNSFDDNKTMPFLISTVICLEDAIKDQDVTPAEKNLTLILEKLHKKKLLGAALPFIFVRVRDFEQLCRITKNTEFLSVLTGFVFPKFSQEKGEKYFPYIQKLNEQIDKTLYVMPILETLDVIQAESSAKNLWEIKSFLDAYQSLVLNIRLGIVDLSGIYALRRSIDQTCYDLAVINNFIAQVVNIFAKAGSGYVVSGPAWEYFNSQALSQHSPSPNLKWLRGLIKETKLDKANGLVGKTVIHPSQILPVQSLYAVPFEEYSDACDILNSSDNGGVLKSVFSNKMNEIKPHYNWAKKIMILAKIYGVLNGKYNYRSLIGKSFEN